MLKKLKWRNIFKKTIFPQKFDSFIDDLNLNGFYYRFVRFLWNHHHIGVFQTNDSFVSGFFWQNMSVPESISGVENFGHVVMGESFLKFENIFIILPTKHIHYLAISSFFICINLVICILIFLFGFFCKCTGWFWKRNTCLWKTCLWKNIW